MYIWVMERMEVKEATVEEARDRVSIDKMMNEVSARGCRVLLWRLLSQGRWMAEQCSEQ